MHIELYYYEWNNGKARSPLYANLEECINECDVMINDGILKNERVEIKSIILREYDFDAINKAFNK